jgi:hypothetical protein
MTTCRRCETDPAQVGGYCPPCAARLPYWPRELAQPNPELVATAREGA